MRLPLLACRKKEKGCQTDGGRATRQCLVGLNSRGQKDQRILRTLCSLFLCYHISNKPCPVSVLCYSQNLFICYHVSNIPCPCLKHTLPCLSPLLLPELVHLLPCLLLQATCLPVYSSTCQLATLPCLSHTLPLSQTYPVPASALCYSQNLFICYHVFLIPYSCLKHTLSPYPPYPVPLSTLPCPYPVTKKVKPYSFTFFFFPLLSLLMRSRAVTTKTYFVCPP